MRSWPTKEQVEHDYNVLGLTLIQICNKYGYYNETTGRKWFRAYGIIPRPILALQKPSKEELESLYLKHNSVKEVAKVLNRSECFISKCFKEYDIKIAYFKNDICNKTLQEELFVISIKEASIKYNTTTTTIKDRIGFIPEVFYDVDRLKSVLLLYDYDNQGTTKGLKLDDPNVLNSLLNHTNNYYLYGNKITERVYRLLNDYSPDFIPLCSSCDSKLKFYTFKQGYGNSELSICSKCIAKQSGTSRPSQKLFWDVYNNVNLDECYFTELNYERAVEVLPEDKKVLSSYSKLNKRRYILDFVAGNKVIEYDGTYWHSDKEKEEAKDAFLRHKGYEVLHIMDDDYTKNPEEQLNRCINFLTK